MIELVERYDVKELRRFAPAKRYVLVACFLVETQKTTLDHLVEMNRVFLTGMSRRARHALENRHKEIRQRAKKGLDTVLQAMDIILDRSRPAATLIDELYREVDEASLRAAVATCRDLRNLGDHGYFNELRTRHSHLKVDSWCGFTQALVPPSGYAARTEKVYPALLAARSTSSPASTCSTSCRATPAARSPARCCASFAPAGWSWSRTRPSAPRAPRSRARCTRSPEEFHEPFYADYLEDDLAALLRDAGFSIESSEPQFVSKVVVARRP